MSNVTRHSRMCHLCKTAIDSSQDLKKHLRARHSHDELIEEVVDHGWQLRLIVSEPADYAEPVQVGGWTNNWGNGKARVIKGAWKSDPEDPRAILRGGKTINIDGKGIAIFNGSPRLHIKGPWDDSVTECTVSNTPAVLIRSRSDHCIKGKPDKWGYSVGFEIKDSEVQIKKEGVHPIYTPRIKTVKVKYNSGENKCANKTYTLPDGSVKIEGCLNDKKVIEAIDDGTWNKWDKVTKEEEAAMKKAGETFKSMQKPILGPRDTNYIRMDKVKGAKVRNFTIRGIIEMEHFKATRGLD